MVNLSRIEDNLIQNNFGYSIFSQIYKRLKFFNYLSRIRDMNKHLGGILTWQNGQSINHIHQ